MLLNLKFMADKQKKSSEDVLGMRLVKTRLSSIE